MSGPTVWCSVVCVYCGLYAVDLTEGVVTATVSHDSKINWLEVRLADPLWYREQSPHPVRYHDFKGGKYTIGSSLFTSVSSFGALIKGAPLKHG